MKQSLLVAGCLALVAVARAQSRPAEVTTEETHTLHVGETIDLEPPGVVSQLVCDHVGELIDVEAEGMTLHVKGLAVGTTACGVDGARERNDAPATDDAPDGGRTGVLTYHLNVKLEVLAAKAGPAPLKKP